MVRMLSSHCKCSVPGQGTKIPHATKHDQKINRALPIKKKVSNVKTAIDLKNMASVIFLIFIWLQQVLTVACEI